MNMNEYVYATNGAPVSDAEGFISLPREEIVRCRDCVRFIPQGTYHFNSGVVNKDTCNVIRGFVVQIDPDSFCAWGERRENEKNTNSF